MLDTPASIAHSPADTRPLTHSGYVAADAPRQPSPDLRALLHRLFEARYALIRLADLAQYQTAKPRQPAGLHQALFHARTILAMPMPDGLTIPGVVAIDRRGTLHAVAWLAAELLLADAALASHGAVQFALQEVARDARTPEGAQ